MNTLVTGGAGFIGSHLVERLVRDGHQVSIIDNFSNGRRENLAFLGNSNSQVKIHEADVANFDSIKDYFNGVDWVFHLAALADIVPSIKMPHHYFQANVDGTFAVMEAARHANVKRIVYTASSSCYGIPNEYPTLESAPINPAYPYALTKFLGEEIALHWAKVYNLPLISLRLFNVYGPRTRTSGTYGAVFGVFLAQKLAGKPFTVVGDGNQTRDFTFVTDVVNAFVTAAASEISGEVFNVGSGESVSVNELVRLLGGDVTYIPKRPGEPDKTFADITKINSRLNWKPEMSFADGVSIMLENIDYWKTAPVWNEESINEATKEWFHYLK